MKPKFTRAEFHFDVVIEGNEKDFSVHWERTINSEYRYLANVFRGGGYKISFPVNVSPNQSNSLDILLQFLNSNQ